MSDGDSYLAFRALEERPGIEIVDRIERRRYTLHTPEPVAPAPVGTEPFQFPVDRAVRLESSELVLPRVVPAYVRDRSGTMMAEVEHLDSASLPEGRYTLELSTQIKTYVEVEGPFEIAADMFQTRIEFGAPTELLLGARSQHRRPAATVTTTENPRDAMAAVSTFGSALKTTTPERSYPTLRGHPPAVELGEELDVPAAVERPDTGVRLELPADLRSVYAAAPLAYYLGAELVPGPTPLLATDDGFEYSLSAPDGFESEVERTLKQVFFLDCLTRTEGYTRIDLHERGAVDSTLDLDFAALYERPLAEQLATYLDVPFELLEAHIPQWQLDAHVESAPDSLEQLPFVVDDLAVVRTTGAASADTGPRPAASQDLTRAGSFTRSSGETAAATTDYVQPETTDALEQAWIGEGVPIGASKLVPEAFYNRFDREKTDGDITITIVVNDTRMDEERDLVDDAYGDRDNLPFEVNVHSGVEVDELREILGQRCDFLHFIGHTEADGIECPDGMLDLSTVPETRVGAFLLNSCSSYDQGVRLIESGAIGGIVTLNDIVNTGAVRMGETIARLLNAGFPLQSALSIASDESALGGQYIVVGDGSMSVAQPESGVPYMLEITQNSDDFAVEMVSYPTENNRMGGVFIPYLSQNDQYYLIPGRSNTKRVGREELVEFLRIQEVPVRYGGSLSLSSSVGEDLSGQ
jgi:hypothetical protein